MGLMSTETELSLEQFQQGVSYEVSPQMGIWAWEDRTRIDDSICETVTHKFTLTMLSALRRSGQVDGVSTVLQLSHSQGHILIVKVQG
ncbi:hypothetical protein Tco_0117685 [Tanacetum coccineum]